MVTTTERAAMSKESLKNVTKKEKEKIYFEILLFKFLLKFGFSWKFLMESNRPIKFIKPIKSILFETNTQGTQNEPVYNWGN